MSKRNPLASVRKLFIKEAMVKTSENCSSCPLQSVEEKRRRRCDKLYFMKSGFKMTRTPRHPEAVEVRM